MTSPAHSTAPPCTLHPQDWSAAQSQVFKIAAVVTVAADHLAGPPQSWPAWHIAVVVSSVLVLLLLGVGVWCWRKRRPRLAGSRLLQESEYI
jgi:O-antigen/teichoic acid export membrane protein